MKGESKKLIQFFEGADKRFCIPLYQRNYAWKKENCRQLFDDLVRVHEQGSKSHFFGSIVSCVADDDDEGRLIIDGQQRITTVSLLLIAMINAAKADDMRCERKDRINYIRNAYLVDEYRDSERKVKLKPIKNDMEAFDALIYKTPDDYLNDSDITKNYYFFYDKVKNCKLTLEELLDAVKKLEIINVRLERDDDPQLIFESLNSTGMGLSESDKIRNYLLMSMSVADQEKAYNAYWNRIEEATDYAPTMFVRDYITVKTKRIAKIENLYIDFKNHHQQSCITRQELMADMLRYALKYKMFIHQQVGDPKLKQKFTQLSYIDSAVHMPFVMSFLLYADEQNLSEAVQWRVFDVIENYWARRIICNLPSNALNKVFSTLHSDVIKLMAAWEKSGAEQSPDYVEVLKYVLLKKQGTAEVPSDMEVIENIKTRNVYKMPKEYKHFLFERLNNGSSKEYVDIVKGMNSGQLSIEHIMPQTLSPRWKADLGDGYQEIYDTYIHTLANLTISAYNQSYSNAPFEAKKNGMTDRDGNWVVGFKDSIYSISADLKNYSKWTETEILARQSVIVDKFIALWPMPTSTFVPMEKPTDSVTLNDDEVELTGRAIAAFTFKGIKKPVISWKAMVLDVCSMAYEQYKTAIDYLCSKDSYYFRQTPQEGYNQFFPGRYAYTDCSTRTKLQLLNLLFQECSIADEELVFDLKPVSTDTDDE